ncbi:MAG: DUF3348 family protein [Pseudomonadales bacterium]
MTNTAALDYRGSQMIRFLDELQITDEPVSPERFSGRLAELIDLSQSVKISIAHTAMSRMEFEPFDNSFDTARDEVMRVHADTVDIIVKAFTDHTGSTRLKAPKPERLNNESQKAAIKPFLSFYAYYQRMLDSKLNTLREYIRNSASGLSVKLAQLAKLDEVLADTLGAHERKSFAQVPILLERRFSEQLQRSQVGQLEELHTSFCRDLQALLLAELEVRMLPVLGLIESIEAEALTQQTITQ